MKVLLTSGGVTNASISDALVRLLGKPIAQATALVVPTAIYPFRGGGVAAARMIQGQGRSPLCELGWASLGVLELTALPSIDRASWVPDVEAADALLVYGGDPLFLSHWLRESGLADLLPALARTVYVGVSAGSMAATTVFGETYVEPPSGRATPLSSEQVVFPTPEGDLERTFMTAAGVGLVDFAVIPHLEGEGHPDASLANAQLWAGRLPVPTYAIDDQTALAVVDGAVQVVSEGQWRLFTP